MNELGLVSIGVLLTLALAAGIWWIDREEMKRRRAQADAVLKRHGMSAERYVASIGQNDFELSAALEEFSAHGHIVLDSNGAVVGALCPSVETRRYLFVTSSKMTSIVDNTKLSND